MYEKINRLYSRHEEEDNEQNKLVLKIQNVGDFLTEKFQTYLLNK